MSHHKPTASAISTRRPKRRTPEQVAARAATIVKYGDKKMIENCTAQNCPELARLIEQKELAETQSRWRDAGDLWRTIQAHARGPECLGQAVAR